MRICNCAVSTLVLVLAAAPAWAQEAKSVDVTPYVGIGSVAASPGGVAVTVPITSTLGIETDVAYRRGEGDIHALSTSASLLWSLPRIGQATPYLAEGVGAVVEVKYSLQYQWREFEDSRRHLCNWINLNAVTRIIW